MGHRLEVKVPVDETLVLQANHQQEGAGEGSLSRLQKALIGISAIFRNIRDYSGMEGLQKTKTRITILVDNQGLTGLFRKHRPYMNTL